jgi:hypothetical protein
MKKIWYAIRGWIVELVALGLAGWALYQGRYFSMIFLLLSVIFVKLTEIARTLHRGATILDAATQPKPKPEAPRDYSD